MANRILRDWTNSEKVNDISLQAEVFFTRLIMKADDFGSFYGNIKILKANLFPLKIDTVRDADISRWIAECEKAGLLLVYTNAGKRYLRINDFGQRLRSMCSRFPSPDSNSPSNDRSSPPEVETEVEEETETRNRSRRRASAGEFKELILENPFSEKFLESWIIWKDYKRKEHRFLFKSIESEQAAINDLVKISEGNEDAAIKIIHQSLAKGWKGFFKLNKDGAAKNGHSIDRDLLNEKFNKRYPSAGQTSN